jgi:hypothetical protein
MNIGLSDECGTLMNIGVCLTNVGLSDECRSV